MCRSDSFETENSSKILILFIAQNNHCFFLHSKKNELSHKCEEKLCLVVQYQKKLVRIINNNLELQPNNTNYLLSSWEFFKDKIVYILEHSTCLTVCICFILGKLLPAVATTANILRTAAGKLWCEYKK